MPEPTEGRVAVYIDFDNIVISRYDQVHGRGHFLREQIRTITADSVRDDRDLAARLERATVDIGAVLDYASSFGSIVISRAYADWSIEVNASYRDQLMERAVDLVQLFPAVRSMKNGADIRLAVDVVEDLFRLPDLSHVIIVAGDSDYIPLAQRAARLGRYVVGIGVAGSTSKFLAAACDEFADYDALPGIGDDSVEDEEDETSAAEPAKTDAEASAETQAEGRARRRANPKAATETTTASAPSKRAKQAAQQAASALLTRALRLGHAKNDADWLASSGVKNQMLRMDPSFQESALGYKNFTEFLKSRGNIVQIKEEGQTRLLRLRSASADEGDGRS
ncbi:NYN domain-containing protein [Salinibacterium sp. SYSU T00001]|uniref:NYN domain-containing protein n=1 Tax=Homoserinimonas sedimenticola TaxID=2986805 RepID=UPI002236AB0D|nr:NYN domain-containing protein [Salinibacterium sedimenticola]MCW4384803.1 NYN domain-containing protein [Salinibacterium sedimenticola]